MREKLIETYAKMAYVQDMKYIVFYSKPNNKLGISLLNSLEELNKFKKELNHDYIMEIIEMDNNYNENQYAAKTIYLKEIKQ